MCVIVAPIMTIAQPTAASGVSTGAMFSARGRISPIAPSTSTAPRALSCVSDQVLDHCMIGSSLSLGMAIFITPASRNMAVRTPVTIQSAMFTVSPYGTHGHDRPGSCLTAESHNSARWRRATPTGLGEQLHHGRGADADDQHAQPPRRQFPADPCADLAAEDRARS